ncbi:hypothetical protein C8F01DRAFT_1256937 [Mycena amicta]|nr:hypothetical protein C8F01DRAFT_1256937 [Mycena amicta]
MLHVQDTVDTLQWIPASPCSHLLLNNEEPTDAELLQIRAPFSLADEIADLVRNTLDIDDDENSNLAGIAASASAFLCLTLALLAHTDAQAFSSESGSGSEPAVGDNDDEEANQEDLVDLEEKCNTTPTHTRNQTRTRPTKMDSAARVVC